MRNKSVVLMLLVLGAGGTWAYEIQKIFHHRLITQATETSGHIDFAKLIFYAKQEPVVKTSYKALSKKSTQACFFLPQAVFNSAEVQKMADRITMTQTPYYTINIKSVEEPQGIEICITYDPSMIIFTTGTFDTITHDKGLEIRLINKALIDTLQKKVQPILTTASIQSPTIVIDCGHGGTDQGTFGCSKVPEKNITLAVGKKLKKELEKHKFNVILTRNSDAFVELDKRTFIANSAIQPALVISLHANNSVSQDVEGLETFCLPPTVCRIMNADTHIISKLAQSDATIAQQSYELARAVHESILQNAQRTGITVVDRKVKKAVPTILHGLRWPGILVELDFLSNIKTAERLNSAYFQMLLAQSICAGIKKFNTH